ncbi:MAG: choice-of-anchor V domain-containing protein [Chitinophagales bacterium]|nr:choice-of-anchor V domain-containing protein [Chitinophagales bacterium]
MKLRLLSIIVLSATIMALFYDMPTAHSNAAQPPAGRTGAPSEGTCNAAGCHSGSSVVASSNEILFKEAPNLDYTEYTPGDTVNLTVNITASSKNGFEITCLDTADNMAGTFILTSTSTTTLQTSGGRQYVGHKNASGTNAWVFKWAAPATNIGPVTFYIAANKANGNNASSGDVIHTQSFTVQPASGGGCGSFDVSINGNTSICPGISTTLSADVVGGSGSNSYLWSTGGSNASIAVNTAGSYSVTVTNGGCVDSARVSVTTAAPPIAAFDVTVFGDTVYISNNSTGTIETSTWSFGDGNSDVIDDGEFAYGYADTGTYTITLTTTNACGGTSTADTTITIASGTGIMQVAHTIEASIFPNPVQGTMMVNVAGNTSFEMTVFDLNGRIVKQANGQAGQTLAIDSKDLNKGLYFYKVVSGNKSTSGKLLVN